ncbi:MAG: GNAT family N-acetyltransferase [Rubrivivax sp.]|nr:GNAT family N-acetyltransferase [Rubrivivax sp.]
MLTVEPLSRCPAMRAMVSAWLLSEWPSWYGQDGPGDLVGDVDAFARSEKSLPVGFVVFRTCEPVGFGTLKQESIPSHKHLSPWAATGFVLPQYRSQGIGAFMLQAIVAHARLIGYQQVYCGTSTATSLLLRAGWQRLERIVHAGKPLELFGSGV